MTIAIEWIETPITIKIDMSKLTWGDVVEIQAAQAEDNASVQATLEAIVTKVTGQNARSMPAQVFTAIVEAMMERANGGGGEPVKN